MSKSTQKYTYTMPTEQYEEMQRFVEANGFRSVIIAKNGGLYKSPAQR